MEKKIEELTDEELLESEGWIIECKSPFEIKHDESNSFATNWAAQSVVDEYRQVDLIGRLKILSSSYKSGIINDRVFIQSVLDKLS